MATDYDYESEKRHAAVQTIPGKEWRYFIENVTTKKQSNLHTRNKAEAQRLLLARRFDCKKSPVKSTVALIASESGRVEPRHSRLQAPNDRGGHRGRSKLSSKIV